MSGRFTGRVAVITGAAQGIGEATARLLAAEGAAVVVADVKDEAGAAVAAALERGLYVRADAADGADVERAVAAALEAFGRLDIAFANAGIGASHRVHELPEADWRRVLDVNLTGAFLLARAALAPMRAQGSGSIVVTSSPHGLATNPATAPYAASKAGLLGFVRAAAVEAGAAGVRVNAVIPGAIDTPMVRDFVAAAPDPEAALRRFARLSVFDRPGRAEEVAEAVAFLCSDAASFVTGSALTVDGGLLATLAGDVEYD